MKPIGRRAYGVVVSTYDEYRNSKVVIKKIKNIFQNSVLTKRIVREVKLMKQFNGQEHILPLLDLITRKNNDKTVDIYLVLTLMESDLDQIIRSPQSLSTAHIKFFLYQLLRALHYIHSAVS